MPAPRRGAGRRRRCWRRGRRAAGRGWRPGPRRSGQVTSSVAVAGVSLAVGHARRDRYREPRAKKGPESRRRWTGCLRSGYGIRALGAVALGTCVPFAEILEIRLVALGRRHLTRRSTALVHRITSVSAWGTSSGAGPPPPDRFPRWSPLPPLRPGRHGRLRPQRDSGTSEAPCNATYRTAGGIDHRASRSLIFGSGRDRYRQVAHSVGGPRSRAPGRPGTERPEIWALGPPGAAPWRRGASRPSL